SFRSKDDESGCGYLAALARNTLGCLVSAKYGPTRCKNCPATHDTNIIAQQLCHCAGATASGNLRLPGHAVQPRTPPAGPVPLISAATCPPPPYPLERRAPKNTSWRELIVR